MSTLLFLAKFAVCTQDKDLKNKLKKIFKYIDKKGCRITSEISDDKIIIYDITNNHYLSQINIDYLNKKLYII